MRAPFPRRFLRDRRGAGSVEFALIAPVLLVLYAGGSEVAMGVSLSRKVQHVGATVNDLVAQSASVSKKEIDQIFEISASILAPYPKAPLRMRVSSVAIDDKGKATVECSRVYDNTATPISPLGKATPFTLPSDLSSLRSRSILVAETRYDYVPFGGYGLKSTAADGSGLMKMGGVSYINPRIGNAVACSDWYS